MNKLIGQIIAIQTSPHMSMVDIDIDGDVFSSIVLETPQSVSYLNIGSTITLLFKETEVSIAKNLSGMISLRNRFKATIFRIESSELLTKIYLNYKDFGVLSIISSRSAKMMELVPGDEVEWLVKTNEVSLCSPWA